MSPGEGACRVRGVECAGARGDAGASGAVAAALVETAGRGRGRPGGRGRALVVAGRLQLRRRRDCRRAGTDPRRRPLPRRPQSPLCRVGPAVDRRGGRGPLLQLLRVQLRQERLAPCRGLSTDSLDRARRWPGGQAAHDRPRRPAEAGPARGAASTAIAASRPGR